MRTSLALSAAGLAFGLATLAAPPEAAAALMTRTVHVAWTVTNASDAPVLVHVSGAYVSLDLMDRPRDYELGPGVGFDGPLDFWDQPIAWVLQPGESDTMDVSVTISDGHTWHYTANIFESDFGRVGAQLAQHQWKARVDLQGVDKCAMVTRVDPEQRLVAGHVRTGRTGFDAFARDVGLALVPGYDVAEALIAGDAMGFLQAAAFENFYNGLDMLVPGLGTLAAVTVEVSEALIKSEPGRCMTHMIIRNPVPAHRRNIPNMPMRDGFGGSDYVRVADFDGDGYPDMVTPSSGRLLFGRSRGLLDWREEVFETTDRWGGSGYTWADDFDGDGVADIASAHGGTVYVRRRGGPLGDFEPEAWPVTSRWGDAGYTFTGDVDGDGRADILSAYRDRILIKRSTGDGFESVERVVAVPGGWGSAGYTFSGDFDGDGRVDIASCNGAGVLVHLSRGDHFDSARWPAPGLWGAAAYTRVGDFDGDGRDDIASMNRGNVYLLLSEGDRFRAETWPTVSEWGAAGYTWVADFDGDGLDDIGSASGGRVIMRLSTGRGWVKEDWSVPDQWGDAGYTRVADFDQDGRFDIATAIGSHVFIRRSHGAGFGFDAPPAVVRDGVVNAAPAQPVRQSSIAPAAVAERAIDGRSGSSARTRVEAAPWFEVDLVRPAVVDLTVRAPAGETLSGVSVQRQDAPCDAGAAEGLALPAAVEARVEALGGGRYLCLRRPAGGALAIDEIELFPR